MIVLDAVVLAYERHQSMLSFASGRFGNGDARGNRDPGRPTVFPSTPEVE